MRKEPNRSRHNKYIKADYDRVDYLAKKTLEFISFKEREEMASLVTKFNNHEMIVQQLIEQRFVLKRSYKQI
jgi:hypothetical protein